MFYTRGLILSEAGLVLQRAQPVGEAGGRSPLEKPAGAARWRSRRRAAAERGRVEGGSRALATGPACFDTALRAGSACGWVRTFRRWYQTLDHREHQSE